MRQHLSFQEHLRRGNAMSRIDVAAIERIVANTIVETARGDHGAVVRN